MRIEFRWVSSLKQATGAVDLPAVPRVGDLVRINGRGHPVRRVVWYVDVPHPFVKVDLSVVSQTD
jgi:hypothetical protein